MDFLWDWKNKYQRMKFFIVGITLLFLLLIFLIGYFRLLVTKKCSFLLTKEAIIYHLSVIIILSRLTSICFISEYLMLYFADFLRLVQIFTICYLFTNSAATYMDMKTVRRLKKLFLILFISYIFFEIIFISLEETFDEMKDMERNYQCQIYNIYHAIVNFGLSIFLCGLSLYLCSKAAQAEHEVASQILSLIESGDLQTEVVMDSSANKRGRKLLRILIRIMLIYSCVSLLGDIVIDIVNENNNKTKCAKKLANPNSIFLYSILFKLSLQLILLHLSIHIISWQFFPKTSRAESIMWGARPPKSEVSYTIDVENSIMFDQSGDLYSISDFARPMRRSTNTGEISSEKFPLSAAGRRLTDYRSTRERSDDRLDNKRRNRNREKSVS